MPFWLHLGGVGGLALPMGGVPMIHKPCPRKPETKDSFSKIPCFLVQRGWYLPKVIYLRNSKLCVSHWDYWGYC